MLKVPNDPVSQLKTGILEDIIKIDIERKYFPGLDKVSDFPTEATGRRQFIVGVFGKVNVRLEVRGKLNSFLIDLPNIIGRRGYQQINRIIRKGLYLFKCISLDYCIVPILHRVDKIIVYFDNNCINVFLASLLHARAF